MKIILNTRYYKLLKIFKDNIGMLELMNTKIL